VERTLLSAAFDVAVDLDFAQAQKRGKEASPTPVENLVKTLSTSFFD
jgi:hypothetical protein